MLERSVRLRRLRIASGGGFPVIELLATEIPMSHVPQVSRPDLVRRAVRLEWITAGWMPIEAAVVIGSGIVAHNLSLTAYGIERALLGDRHDYQRVADGAARGAGPVAFAFGLIALLNLVREELLTESPETAWGAAFFFV
jgi:hypothetical protein